jgi:hypothetical protein
MPSISRSAAALAAVAALALAPATAGARHVSVPRRPQVKVLGFTTFPRVGVPPVQARPGRTLSDCYDGYNGQREVNVVWQGFGIPKGTKMGIALWGGPPDLALAEPSDADTMRAGFAWTHKRSQKVQLPYGYTFGDTGFGPQSVDGTWTVKILVKGRVAVRRQVTIACR